MKFDEALKIEDFTFENILEIMKLQRDASNVDTVRNLLMATNLILEYFMNREGSELKVPVVYFPCCTEYAQDLCEDFITLKLGLYSNNIWKNRLCTNLRSPTLVIPPDVRTPIQKVLFQKNLKFERTLSRILSRTEARHTDCGKSLIYSKKLQNLHIEYLKSNNPNNKKNVNRYWYLGHAINHSKNFMTGICPLSIIDTDSKTFYQKLTSSNNNANIENIIVFPFGAADGKYSNFCSESFQKCYIDDMVAAGCGLKNIFFFCFSRKPYKLRRLLDFKLQMKERLQIFDDNAYDFISFTYDEALTLCNINNKNPITLCLGKEYNDLQDDYEKIFDELTKGLDRSITRRNEMSLCVNNINNLNYFKQLLDDTEADDSILSPIIEYNCNLWQQEINNKLSHFIYNESLFVITGFDIDKEIKSNFKNFLLNEYGASSVDFGIFSDLKGQLVDGIYQNRIKQKRILVMSFRNDYSDSIFNRYPNSFDPLCINPDQQVMHICNYFYLRLYYDWGKYNYEKTKKKILKSDFRTSQMQPIFSTQNKPDQRIIEDTHELDDDRSPSYIVQKANVIFENNKQREFNKSEWMLCKIGEDFIICPLSDLSDTTQNLLIQSLTPLIRYVYSKYVEDERDNDNRAERMFKEQSIYGLNDEEILSETQLWKILLKKRIDRFGSKVVYDDIMANIEERFKVSYYSFTRWIEPDYGIPRAKKVQKYLIENYLNIRPPYINLIRRIKERTKNNTEEITNTIKHFLRTALLNSDYTIVYNNLSEETKDLLGINSPTDIENIITNVKEIINLEPVTSITYDN